MPETAITESVLIRRPILDVFEYAADPHRLTEWVPLYERVQVPAGFNHCAPNNQLSIWVGAGPFGYWEQVRCLGMAPGRSITYQSAFSPQTGTYTFEPTGCGTLVTASHTP